MTADEYDYFASFEGQLRAAIRRGEHLPSRRTTSTAAPRQGIARKLARDPLRGRRRYRVALAAACVLAAVVLITVGLGSGAPRAFAGWTAAPSAPTHAEKVAAMRRCRSWLDRDRESFRNEDRRLEGLAARPASPLLESPASFKAVAVDIRGPYAFSLLIDGDRQATCFIGPRVSGHRSGADGYSYYNPAPALAADEISNFAGGITTVGGLGGEPAHTFAAGRVGTGVEGVTLLLGGGRRVVTTTAKGWYLAWWPGRGHVLAAEVKTASGVLRRAAPRP